MPKLTYQRVLDSKEHILWKELFEVAKQYNISDESIFSRVDLSGIYWEPFFERLYKLGNIMKVTKKLKEIRIDWIRPILYFGARSDGIIDFDGRHDLVDKGAMSDCSVVKYSFINVVNVIRSIDTLNETNFKEVYKNFKKEIKYFFKVLYKYVKDGGFYLMHQHVKLVLKPLLDLRRAGYRLFSLEKYEANYLHLTFFNDTESLKIFMNKTNEFFKLETFLHDKKSKPEELKDYILKRDTNENNLKYNFKNDLRRVTSAGPVNPYATVVGFNKNKNLNTEKSNSYGKKNKSKKTLDKEEREKIAFEKKRRELMLPNIENLNQAQPTQLKHEVYQLKFEEGLTSIIEYLNDKLNKDFPCMIDTHKIFVNIKCIPNGIKNDASNFYLSQLIEQIELLKKLCYEMKLNGITRVLMPITENKEIIKVIKEIYDLHVIIDTIMGNYLLHEQYIFIYNALNFIKNSSVSEQIEKLKNKDFMEEYVPKYVLFQLLCHSANVLDKMRKYYKEEIGRPFVYEDSYQITNHELGKDENELIYSYEIYGTYQKFFTDEIKEKKKKFDDEVKLFGRFWLIEGLFDESTKKNWLETIDLLSTINILVREDIRDTFICQKEKLEPELNSSTSRNNSRENSSKNTENQIKKSKNKLNPVKRRKSINRNDSSKSNKGLLRKNTAKKYSTRSTFENMKIPKDLSKLRPPSVWNYPVHRIEKIMLDGGLQEEKKEIRNVDPTICYKDKRVEKFKKNFEILYNEMKKYLSNKADLWDYFFNKTFKALHISYVTSKEIKAAEELQRQIEEELKRKEEEELKLQEEREKEMEKNKLIKKEEKEDVKEDDKKKEKGVAAKKEDKKEEKKEDKKEGQRDDKKKKTAKKSAKKK